MHLYQSPHDMGHICIVWVISVSYMHHVGHIWVICVSYMGQQLVMGITDPGDSGPWGQLPLGQLTGIPIDTHDGLRQAAQKRFMPTIVKATLATLGTLSQRSAFAKFCCHNKACAFGCITQTSKDGRGVLNYFLFSVFELHF